MANEPNKSVPTVRESFTEYFEGWQVRQKSYLDKMLDHLNDPNNDENSLGHLVEQVLCHYQEYFEKKMKAAESDVFIMFSPPWFSSFECTLFWVTGFKPSLTFRLVNETLGDDLTEDQKARIERVGEETRVKEAEIEKALASVQESVAAPPFYGLVKREARLVDGEVGELDGAVEGLKVALLEVIKDADLLRQNSAVEVIEILTPVQRVKLLIGKAQFWLQARRFGPDRDNERKLKENQLQ